MSISSVNNNKPTQLLIGNNAIVDVTEFKDIGVIIDTNLNFLSHIYS